LALARQLKDRRGEGVSLGNLGNTYSVLRDDFRAIELYGKSIAIARELKDRLLESTLVGNLGIIYTKVGKYPEAIESHQQHLAIVREFKDRLGEGIALGNLGNVYYSLGNYPKAIEFYQQVLKIAREIGDWNSEALSLNHLANTLVQQKQPALAIIFNKQAINIQESIRKGLSSLPEEQQRLYVESKSNSYRNLADLLFQQNRVVEALQILDLLKVQELQDFLKDVKGNERTAQGIELLPEEQRILSQIRTSKFSDLNTYFRSSTINNLVQKLQKTATAQNLKLSAYSDL
jgi:tetratricopeptide (TPR) repeat protein